MADKVLTGKDIEKILIIAQDVLSLNARVGNDLEESDMELGDFLEDPAPNPEEEAMRADRHDVLMQLIAKWLEPREAKIIALRFGLEDGIPLTLEEIGKELGVTRERVRQVEDRALRKLRYKFATNNITWENI